MNIVNKVVVNFLFSFLIFNLNAESGGGGEEEKKIGGFFSTEI